MTKEQERCVTEFLMWWLMTYGGGPVAWSRLREDAHLERFAEYEAAMNALGAEPPDIVDGVHTDNAELNAWAWGLLQREEI